MAFPTLVATDQWNPGVSIALHRATMPAGIVAGDLLAVLDFAHTGGATTVDSKWTFGGRVGATGFGQGQLFYCIADGSETGDLPVVTYGAGKFGGSITFLIRGYTGIPEMAATPGNTIASATSIDVPELIPSGGAADYLWLAPSTIAVGGRTATPPAGYGSQISGPASGMSTLSYAVSRRNLNAVSEDPGAVAWSGAAAGMAASLISVQGITVAAGRSQGMVI